MFSRFIDWAAFSPLFWFVFGLLALFFIAGDGSSFWTVWDFVLFVLCGYMFFETLEAKQNKE